MRKILTAVVLLFSIMASAQIKTGPYIGPSSYTYLNKTLGDNQVTIKGPEKGTAIIGWFIEPKLYKHIYLETGFNYSKKRSSLNDNATGKYEISYPTIGIPTIINYYPIHKKFKLFISGGHQFIANMEGEITQNYSTDPLIFGKEGYFNKWNSELVAGGGIGFGRLFICYRYTHGISNIIKIAPYDYRITSQQILLKLNVGKRNNS